MKIKLITEFVALFILLPIVLLVNILPKYMIIPSLWAVFIYAYFILRSNKQTLFYDEPQKKELDYVLIRFFILSIIIYIFTFLFYQNKLFELILKEPYTYLAIIILYPLLSVIPQEFVFRRFFFYRYHSGISNFAFIWLNAIVFGFVHCAFRNYLAVVFTIVGGLLFASTYQKTNSLKLVIIEHSLYGILIFTLGLGEFFYHNNNF